MSTSPHTTTRPPGFLVTHDQRTRQSHALWARHLVNDVVNSHLIALDPKLERTYHLCDERVLDETMAQSLDRKIDLVFWAYSAFELASLSAVRSVAVSAVFPAPT